MRLRDRIQETGQALIEPGGFRLPPGLINLGFAAWLFVGAIAALLIVAAFFVLSASISVPLILAAVIGTVAYPVAEMIRRRGAPPWVAATVVLVGLALVIGLTIWLVVTGVVAQWPQISANVSAGIEELAGQATALGLDAETVEATAQRALESGSSALSGFVSNIFASLASGISGIFGLFFGIFISVTLLYYILSDFPTLRDWTGSHIGLPKDLGDGIVDDAVDSLRGYFRGTTLTGFAVAAVITAAAFLLGVPLAIPIGLVTFLTCYIPYFGAIFSGAFAFIIALGSGGLTVAVSLLVIVLVAQNVLQTVISAKFMGESLALHPIVVLVVTMLGGTFAGLLGAALAAPLTALGVRAGARLRAYSDAGLLDDDEPEPEAA
jgi:predicted PurR-regulated permease PerM